MERIRTAMRLPPADYRTDERLVEVNFGDWEGHTLSELQVLWPDRLKARARGKWDFIPPGQDAESYEILSWRVGSWLKSVTRDTVCVSHGGVIRSVLRLVGGYSGDAAADASIPQDQILVIHPLEGRVDWVDGASARIG